MRRNGFTLIELMIGMAIAAILVMLALPAYRDFRANTQVRNAADTIMHGVRLAQVEAIRLNQNVTLEIDPLVGWEILDAGGVRVGAETFNDSTGQLLITPRPAGAVKLTYSPLGQYIGPNNPDDGTDAVTSIRVSTTSISAPNELRVTTDPVWGGPRVCEPKFVYPADPGGCPVGLP